MKSHVGIFVIGLITVSACAARAQEPPVLPAATPPAAVPQVAAPPAQSPEPQPAAAQQPPAQTPPVQPPPSPASQSAPAQAPTTPTVPASDAAPAVTTPPPARTLSTAPLSQDEMRGRRNAMFLMEGVFVNAVRLAAANTAGQIQAVEPAPIIFTSAPARAHGSYLDGYGVFFHVEIPSVVPSVASYLETIQRERLRQSNPAQQTSMPGSAGGSPVALNPDAHYVESVKRQLIAAMLDHSKALDLRADEWLTVEAREAQEAPGQIQQPSTLVLRVRGSDLAEFQALRLTREEILKRVQIRGF